MQWRFYVARRYDTQIVAHSTANRTVVDGLRCVGYQPVRTRFREQVYVRSGAPGRRVAVGAGYVVTAYTQAHLDDILDRLRRALAAGPRRRG